MDAPKSSAPARPTLDPATRLPDHELIRLDAATHPERTHREYFEAARELAGRTYVEDLRSDDPVIRQRTACRVYSGAMTDEEVVLEELMWNLGVLEGVIPEVGSWIGAAASWAEGKGGTGAAPSSGPGLP